MPPTLGLLSHQSQLSLLSLSLLNSIVNIYVIILCIKCSTIFYHMHLKIHYFLKKGRIIKYYKNAVSLFMCWMKIKILSEPSIS